MRLPDKKYCNYLTRVLLLAGYLFLLASQFNYRYYGIANFYVYGSSGTNVDQANVTGSSVAAGKAVKVVGELGQGSHGAIAIFNKKQHQNHLSIDKRFRFQHGVRVPEIRAPGVPCYVIATIAHKPLVTFFSSTERPTTCLRGPPHA